MRVNVTVRGVSGYEFSFRVLCQACNLKTFVSDVDDVSVCALHLLFNISPNIWWLRAPQMKRFSLEFEFSSVPLSVEFEKKKEKRMLTSLEVEGIAFAESGVVFCFGGRCAIVLN